MSVLVYVELSDGGFKKKSFEAVNYAAKVAETFGGDVTAIVIGDTTEDQAKLLGEYGANEVLIAGGAELKDFNPIKYAKALEQAARHKDTKVMVLPFDMQGKSLGPILAADLKAGLVAGAVEYPTQDEGFTVKKTVFSGKAFAYINITSDVKIISFVPNSHAVVKNEKTASVSNFSPELSGDIPKIKVTGEDKVTGEVPLTEAELVVSGGRGMKGPENWGILEELATSLGASLACSRPVADEHWRPHNEHVGQTGGTIRPNLYVAVGISGAIQHLAGVNSSKTIVVINKDPEAPFFKSADYGVVGDAFEIIPKLTEAIKEFKAGN